MDYLILIDKPIGVTSYKIIKDIKKDLNLKNIKIGHAGTLDPFASGLLIILVGKATKLFDFFNKFDKEYEGDFQLGYTTDTLDIDGKINETQKNINSSNFEKNIKKFINTIYLQTPPKFSATKIDGKKAYELARQNIDFTLKEKERKVYSLEVFEKDLSQNIYSFKTKVSKGTYIRQLIYDLNILDNNLATCISLRRTKIHNLTLDSIKLNNKEEKYTKIELVEFLKNNLETVVFNDFSAKLIKNGAKLSTNHTPIRKDFLAYDQNNNPLAYYSYDSCLDSYIPNIIL